MGVVVLMAASTDESGRDPAGGPGLGVAVRAQAAVLWHNRKKKKKRRGEK